MAPSLPLLQLLLTGTPLIPPSLTLLLLEFFRRRLLAVHLLVFRNDLINGRAQEIEPPIVVAEDVGCKHIITEMVSSVRELGSSGVDGLDRGRGRTLAAAVCQIHLIMDWQRLLVICPKRVQVVAVVFPDELLDR